MHVVAPPKVFRVLDFIVGTDLGSGTALTGFTLRTAVPREPDRLRSCASQGRYRNFLVVA